MAGGGGVIDEVRSGRRRRGERYGAQVWRDRTGTLRGVETAGEEEEERSGSGALQSLSSDENKHDRLRKENVFFTKTAERAGILRERKYI